jgi:radical SAM-linked protein
MSPEAAAISPTKCRVRLRYRKLGRARFIGTLEMTTLFYRAARRAALPIAFSQGHHPLPRFAFSPALPLGMESDAEVVDVDLSEIVPPENVRVSFNEQMPEGIEIIDAVSLARRAPSIGSEICAFRYRIDATALFADSGRDAVQRRIDAFLSAADFPLSKHAKGATRLVNARPFVLELALGDDASIELIIAFGASGTLKPNELLGAILELSPEAVSALRVRKIGTLLQTPVSPEPASPIAAIPA